jgi:hypothetical protein
VIPPDGLGDGTPTHPIVIPPTAVGEPTQPIYIPPEMVGPPGAPGVPTHPIRLPPLVPTHPIAGGPSSVNYVMVWAPGVGTAWLYIGGKPDQGLPPAQPGAPQPPTPQPVRR